MVKRSLLTTFLFCVVLACATAGAQSNLCPTGTSDKLICLLPGTFDNGLTLKTGNHQGHFGADSFLSNGLTPLNSALATQSVLLPLASPSSGLTFAWDPKITLFVPTTSTTVRMHQRTQRAPSILRIRPTTNLPVVSSEM